jgi:hypothetical protein
MNPHITEIRRLLKMLNLKGNAAQMIKRAIEAELDSLSHDLCTCPHE